MTCSQGDLSVKVDSSICGSMGYGSFADDPTDGEKVTDGPSDVVGACAERQEVHKFEVCSIVLK